MRHPLLLVIGHDNSVAELLRRDPACAPFAIHDARRWETCRDLLASGRPAVVVLHVGRDVVKEFTLLDRLHQLFPEIPCIAVGENSGLAGLAHDLGARLALFPPLPRYLLGAAAAGFMLATLPAEEQSGSHQEDFDVPAPSSE